MSAPPRPDLRKCWKTDEDASVARMIPDSPVDTDSTAEKRLFERFRDELPPQGRRLPLGRVAAPGREGPAGAGRVRLRPRTPGLRRPHARGEGRDDPLRRADRALDDDRQAGRFLAGASDDTYSPEIRAVG